MNKAVNAITKLVTGGGLDLTTIIGLTGEIFTAFEGIITIVRDVVGTIKERFRNVFKAIDLFLAKWLKWAGYKASDWHDEEDKPNEEKNKSRGMSR